MRIGASPLDQHQRQPSFPDSLQFLAPKIADPIQLSFWKAAIDDRVKSGHRETA
jgi:hypothetical protein